MCWSRAETRETGPFRLPSSTFRPLAHGALLAAFSTDASKTTLITTITLHNLLQVPSPGTTFTTYNVVWTSSDGNQYATQVTAPDPSGSLSYFWGPWNSDTDAISTFNSTTGTFNA